MKYKVLVFIGLFLLVGCVNATTLLVRTTNTEQDTSIWTQNYISSAEKNFAYMRVDESANSINPTDNNTIYFYTHNGNMFHRWSRAVITLNTSGVPDDATIDSATLGLYGGAVKLDGFYYAPEFVITGYTLENTSTIKTTDYADFIDTIYAGNI